MVSGIIFRLKQRLGVAQKEWEATNLRRFSGEVTKKKDPFPLPWKDCILEEVSGNEAYSFLDGYHRPFNDHILPEKTSFRPH